MLTWCFGVYLLLVEDRIFYRCLKQKLGAEKVILKFRRADELVISCAIFAKMLISHPQTSERPSQIDMDSKRLIESLNLDQELLLQMFNQIVSSLDEPIRVHAVWKVIHRQANGIKNINEFKAFDYNKTVESLTQHDVTNKVSKFKYD